MNNVFKTPDGRTIIFNGGDSIDDCPRDWDKATAWAEARNATREGKPQWSWDCGFKLDHDGDIVRISSRFYPPKTHYGAGWDGMVSVYVIDRDCYERRFEHETLEQLAVEVEAFVDDLVKGISGVVKGYLALLPSEEGSAP